MGNVFHGMAGRQFSTGRDYSIDEKKKGCAVPVTPWLHPPVGKRLRDLDHQAWNRS